MIADDEPDAERGQVLRGVVGPADRDDVLVAQAQLVDRPQPEVLEAADDHVAVSGVIAGVDGAGMASSLRSPSTDRCGIIRGPWARSSMAEQVTLNHWVEGSSPSGLTTL